MKYCPTFRKKEILPFPTTQTKLEGTMLNELSQIENNKYFMVLLKCGFLKKNPTQRVEWLPETRGGEIGGGWKSYQILRTQCTGW